MSRPHALVSRFPEQRSGGRGARDAWRVSRRLGFTLALAFTLLEGCYTYVPFNAAMPAPGTQLELVLNDQGRVAVGERLGPEVASVDGTLVGITGPRYELHIAKVQYLDGTSSSWGGEGVELLQQHIKSVLERKFSKGRTVAAILAGVGAVSAFIITRNIIGNGTGEPPLKGGGGTNGQ
ncbi:MAG TPA: hypothetical protein VFW98_03640 [Gemmatimonadaceae bacterium]|nr:hypothetical protein [Gemmatimonadaceae bacterium]